MRLRTHSWRRKKETDWSKVVASAGDEREACIRDLVSRMTFEEKIEQMSGDLKFYDIPIMLARYNARTFNSGANKRLRIPPLRFTDGPRGVALNHSSCFPVAIARSATWDLHLEELVASAMGVEARAQGANLVAAVCVNLVRHPAWGRAQETFGEDSHLTGQMGAATVRGLQRHVMACVKHLACNNIEGSRFHVDVRIDERSLREVYLPHFHACVQAGAASIMTAYNKVNGRYCSQNPHLLRDILKGDWGFNGFVISDFIYGTRNTVRAANAGLDVEMPNARYFGKKLRKAVWNGKVQPALLDEAVTRILREKARFDSKGEGTGYKRGRVASSEHVGLALEAARRSIVLLKNERGALPIKLDGVSRIALIGDLADYANLGDYGSSRVRPPHAVTPLQGIRNRVGEAAEVVYSRGDDIFTARQAARQADATIVFAGLTGKDEGEALPFSKAGGDRACLDLPPAQVELIEAVCEESERCIVVLEGGSAITMEEWRSKPAAILMAWYPGMQGGNAIADIVLGKENPSGKLPVTFPKSQGQLPRFDNKTRSVQYGYYHGYRFFDKTGSEPAFAFGFGLHYTSYSYSNLRLSAAKIARDGRLEVRVDVSNDGDMDGYEVVQMYVGYPASRVERPLKELKGFSLLRLKPGESKSVTMDLEAEYLAYYDIDSQSWLIEETEYMLYVGASSRQQDLLRESFSIGIT